MRAGVSFKVLAANESICVVTASNSRLVALARRHLPSAVAERWIALLRPALRLRGWNPGERYVGQLGGIPSLPKDLAWPQWEGAGSLNFVASLDCGQLQPDRLDIPFPHTGTLLFFYFDPDSGYFDPQYPPPSVNPRDPETLVGTRVIHIPAGVPTAERATPADIDQPYDCVPLTARPIITGPDWSDPTFRKACRDLPEEDRAFLDDWNHADLFRNAMDRQARRPWHRIGGYAEPVQDALEHDDWTLLAQIDSDKAAGMMWGDVGSLYWLIRRDDLAASNFEASSFDWQCS